MSLDGITGPGLLLVLTVAVVGVLHTIVPDHWVPITLIARQHGWSRAETARAALQAGSGHVLTTLMIGLVVWFAGVEFATSFGHVVDTIASAALVLFGAWIGLGAWRERHGRRDGHSHGGLFGHNHAHGEHEHAHGPHHHGDHGRCEDAAHDRIYAPLTGVAVLTRHAHAHRHGGTVHAHWHDHAADTAHDVTPDINAAPPGHTHRHKVSVRTALLLILGSSPMVEGIPAFLAASRYGFATILLMAVAFAASTILTYVALCVYSTVGLQRVSLGPLERYGEVISGAFIALVGVAFWVWPLV